MNREGSHISGLVAIQADEFLTVADGELMRSEEAEATTFRSNARVIMRNEVMDFDDVRLRMDESRGIQMEQQD